MFLPVQIPSLIPKEGMEIKFNNNPIFSTFWNEFRNFLKYESYIDGKIDSPLFFTKTGNKPLGGLFRLGKEIWFYSPFFFIQKNLLNMKRKKLIGPTRPLNLATV